MKGGLEGGFSRRAWKGALRRCLKGDLRRGFKGGLRRRDLEFLKGASRVFQTFEKGLHGGLEKPQGFQLSPNWKEGLKEGLREAEGLKKSLRGLEEV